MTWRRRPPQRGEGAVFPASEMGLVAIATHSRLGSGGLTDERVGGTVTQGRPATSGLGMQGKALRETIAAESAAPPTDLLTSVARALDVLELIASSPEPLPAKAVSLSLQTSLGTAYHVLHTLEHAGYVVRLGHGRFGLGGKIPALTRRFAQGCDATPMIVGHLESLAERSGEDAYLAVMRSGEIVVTEVVEASVDLHVGDLGIGFSRIAHTTALGKVLLAGAGDEAAGRYLHERELRRFTARTLIEQRHLKRHLAAVRERGMALDLEELADGCCCVSFPVVGCEGTSVAAVAISTTSARWRREHERLSRLCEEAARDASEQLGAPLAAAQPDPPGWRGESRRGRIASP